MKVAAYQAPLLPAASMRALELIRGRVAQCEAEGIAILCCPEAVLGGLADDSDDPGAFAVPTNLIAATLGRLGSDAVTTIVGFTERAGAGDLYNAAAVCTRGTVAGVYRKHHPAIHRSVYQPGRDTPIFRAGPLTFGIAICNDSNFIEPARRLATLGAAVLFVPTNNGLPPDKGGRDVVARARTVDVARATENRLWVIRADVAGSAGDLVSYGSSAIVDPSGTVVRAARELSEDLLVAEVDVGSGAGRRRAGD